MTYDYFKQLKKEFIFFGSNKHARDIEFIFNINFHSVLSFDADNLCNYYFDTDKYYYIFEKNHFPNVLINPDNYSYDEDLFDYLNSYIRDYIFSDKFIVWGAGKYGVDFYEFCSKTGVADKIAYYVDSNADNINSNDNFTFLRKSVEIKNISSLYENNYPIVIAANLYNTYKIQEQCSSSDEISGRLIHFSEITANLGDELRKTYYDNNYYDAECLNMDNTLRIKNNGNVLVCCLSKPDNILGNVFINKLETIYHSLQAKIRRLALLNHSYTFCDHFRCPFLSGIKSTPGCCGYEEKYSYTDKTLPDSIAPEIDHSCNLHCQSCRKEIFIEDTEQIRHFTELTIQRLLPLPTRFLINTVGEVFASKNSMNILNEACFQNREDISIYTNGTLLTPVKLEHLLEHFKNIELSISVDAATPETYEKLRRGGNYKKLCQNLDYIAALRRKGKISHLQLNFTLQKNNVKEMQPFINQAKNWHADSVLINALENWGAFTNEEYEELSLIKDGRIKEEYLAYFTNEIKSDPLVDLMNFSNLLGLTPKYIRMI